MSIFNRNKTLLFVLSICTIINAKAQSVVTASLERDTILIGDQINLQFEIQNVPQKTTVVFPKVGDSIAQIEILEQFSIDTISKGNNFNYKKELLITAFDEGNYQLPSFSFFIKENEKEVYQLSTKPLQLYVKTIDVDTAKPFKDINPILDEDDIDFITKVSEFIKENKWFFIIGIASLFILLGMLIYFIFRKKKTLIKAIEVPHVKALRLLSEIEKSDLWQQGKYKDYYTGVSDIIRNYLEETSEFSAVEMTTRDLLYAVKHNKNYRTIHQVLKIILQQSDLVKFAKMVPDAADRDEMLKSARKLIARTIEIQKEEVIAQ